MASPDDAAAAAAAEVSGDSDQTFPAVDAEKELNPELNKSVQVDPVSSDVATSTEIKEKQIELPGKEKGGKDGMQKLKTTIIISGVAVAVAGAIFAAFTRKLMREKR